MEPVSGISVTSSSAIPADALAVGCSFTRWPTAPSMAAYDRDAALIKDWHVRNPIGLVRRMGSEVLFGPADRYARDVLALATGVPLICIPQGRDQKDNAARVVAAGAGVRVPRQAGPRRIRQAVQQILTTASYRVQARRLAEAFAAEAVSGPDAVAEVHAVLRHKRLDQG